MAARHKIDRAFLRALKPKEKNEEFSDQELRGFGVRLSPAGRITYLIRWVKPDRRQGRRVIGSFPELNPSEARELAREELRNVNKIGDTSAEVFARKHRLDEVAKIIQTGQTLADYLDGSYRKQTTIKFKSAEKTINCIKSVFKAFLDQKLAEITTEQIKDWRYARLKRGIKASSLEREVNALKGLFSRAVVDQLITDNPVKGLERLNIVQEGRVRWLSREEERRLRLALDQRQERDRLGRESGNKWRLERKVELLPDMRNLTYTDHVKPMVLLSINTGVRQGELLSLEWPMVDLERRQLTVSAANSKSSKVRHIPLNDEAYSALNGWKKQTNKSQGYVFEGQEGLPMTSLKTAWKKLLIDAEITNFTWHDMRHHFASWLVMGGVDLNTVRELLGHSDIKMTLRYAHLEPEHKAAAVAKLNRAVV